MTQSGATVGSLIVTFTSFGPTCVMLAIVGALVAAEKEEIMRVGMETKVVVVIYTLDVSSHITQSGKATSRIRELPSTQFGSNHLYAHANYLLPIYMPFSLCMLKVYW